MKQAGQNVPDWLMSGNFEVANGGHSFGGRDIREVSSDINRTLKF